MVDKKHKFAWAPWAHLQALYAALFILFGGIVGFFYPTNQRLFAIIACGVSLVILGIEFFEAVRIPILTTNYFVWGLLLCGACGASMFFAPCNTGGLCMGCAGLTYLRAGIAGENGYPPKKAVRK